MDMGESGITLISIFITNFKISEIYNLGWDAARSWMVLVSGVVITIAIGIRSMEEQTNLLTKGQANYGDMVVKVFIIALAMVSYFALASLIIDFFNGIYSHLNNGAMVQFTNELEDTLKKIKQKDYKFSFAEIGNSALWIFAFIAYWLTHIILVCVTAAMRIAHAVLTSWLLFWGAVALPMSITTGLGHLKGFKNMSVMVLLWPIVELFFTYVVGGAFKASLDKGLAVDDIQNFTVGIYVTYLTAYAVINILLAATIISAPIVAQGLANNSGNVGGMIGSFAGAGIAAGMLATKAMFPPQLRDKMTGKIGQSGSNAFKNIFGNGSRKVDPAGAAKNLVSSGLDAIQGLREKISPPPLTGGLGLSGGESDGKGRLRNPGGPSPQLKNSTSASQSLSSSPGVGTAKAETKEKPSIYTGGTTSLRESQTTTPRANNSNTSDRTSGETEQTRQKNLSGFTGVGGNKKTPTVSNKFTGGFSDTKKPIITNTENQNVPSSKSSQKTASSKVRSSTETGLKAKTKEGSNSETQKTNKASSTEPKIIATSQVGNTSETGLKATAQTGSSSETQTTNKTSTTESSPTTATSKVGDTSETGLKATAEMERKQAESKPIGYGGLSKPVTQRKTASDSTTNKGTESKKNTDQKKTDSSKVEATSN
ncbi:MAG: hypothetical protein JKY54_05025, partial [Flavobacteriales bacterium]|nr:hypothetical protein [Flavobacteriales bacterium]